MVKLEMVNGMVFYVKFTEIHFIFPGIDNTYSVIECSNGAKYNVKGSINEVYRIRGIVP